MAVALADLIEPLKVALNPPGRDLFDATNTEWVLRLANAFWSAHLEGHYSQYRINDNDEIVNLDEGGDDISRDMQQIVVLRATIDAIDARLTNLPHGRRSKAGPVETEVTMLASVLVELLRAKRKELLDLRDRLVDGTTESVGVYVIDGVIARTQSLLSGCTAWVN